MVASLWRNVAIEVGMWRVVLSGGAARAVILGNARFLEALGGRRFRGGNRLPFGDQESVCGDAERGVMVEAAPFEMSETEFLLELLIIALDAPAQFGEIGRRAKPISSGRLESQYLAGSFSPLGHSIRSHSTGQGSLRLKSRFAMRMRIRAKRDPSGAFVPSRQAIVRQVSGGRLKARSLTVADGPPTARHVRLGRQGPRAGRPHGGVRQDAAPRPPNAFLSWESSCRR